MRVCACDGWMDVCSVRPPGGSPAVHAFKHRHHEITWLLEWDVVGKRMNLRKLSSDSDSTSVQNTERNKNLCVFDKNELYFALGLYSQLVCRTLQLFLIEGLWKRTGPVTVKRVTAVFTQACWVTVACRCGTSATGSTKRVLKLWMTSCVIWTGLVFACSNSQIIWLVFRKGNDFKVIYLLVVFVFQSNITITVLLPTKYFIIHLDPSHTGQNVTEAT